MPSKDSTNGATSPVLSTLITMWTSEDDFWELALSFHQMDPRDGTWVLRLGDKCYYPLSHPLVGIAFINTIG